MKLIVHIGTEKTGTTAIQAALRRDQDRLKAQGVLFPLLFDTPNHMEIAVAAMNAQAQNELILIELARLQCGHDEYRAHVAQMLRDEIQAARPHTLILSNEHIHSRLRTPEELARILALLPEQPTEVQLVCYLRRQDRMAVSLYSTVLKGGGEGDVFPQALPTELPYYFDYGNMLSNQAEVFGEDAITLRLYERDRLLNGDVVEDFFNLIGAEPPTGHPIRANLSLSAQQVQFLKLFNERFPLIVDDKINPNRGPIMKAVTKVRGGSSYRPARQRAQAFCQLFEASNAEVRDRWLPALDRPMLFDDRFDEYPEIEPDLTLDEAAMMDFVEAIWSIKQPPFGT